MKTMAGLAAAAFCAACVGMMCAVTGCAGQTQAAEGPARPSIDFAAPGDAGPWCVVAGPSRAAAAHPDVMHRVPGGAPTLVPVAGGRTLKVWMDGSVEDGYLVRFATLSAAGEPVGPTMVLSDDLGAVVGRIDATVDGSGKGELTYLASTQEEFRLVSTPIRCNAP
jgi:hypothetical protein